ncbi:acetylornithine deacetylase [Halomonas elongata]|uniref:Acetylornithine deacetylase n=1 Tax=Halomonas elongata (strain ATCC 33173 / DSM 2581 / NBRC 15536 / NCIMB 2198 / 1H9) TaxID=768066 RepID=E1V5B9_HALED|nr:acetylornithine deacetylase [Halomonas elongata]WBF16815.1 acetylornithine deacetylase [Halomonas elongata]WPU45646.1 acetylornithine deacetylase [Halomonas elongata DSM 2581]CBV43074.1 acetylornithine deacetylase [Halomonas elongata DSM 2581]
MTAVEILERLVGFATVSRDSNLALIEWVEAWLDDHDVEHWRIESDDGGKANLLARIGPAVEGGVVLSGHTDVVPVVGQPWSSDPFVLRDGNDGRLYGRGTCDMKGFIACVLAEVPNWVEMTLERPLWLAFSYDEEIGCVGAPRMIERLMSDHPRPSTVIVGEPTLMQPVVAQKGATNLRTTVTGRAAHSSQVYQGVSAIHVAARLVTKIEDVMAELKAEGRVDEAFNVVHSSLHVGRIEGGTAINIMARECTFEWEVRHLPSDNVDELLGRIDAYAAELQAEMQQTAPEAGIATEALNVTVPALADRDNDEVLTLCRSLLGDDIDTSAVAYATEAGQFQRQGLSTLICGPGSISQAHQPDEYIEREQLEAGQRFMAALGARLSSGASA